MTLDGLWASVEELVSGSHLFRSLEDSARRDLIASAPTVEVTVAVAGICDVFPYLPGCPR